MPDNQKKLRFHQAYQGIPPWDLGRPQNQFVEMADQVFGSVLDTGCGTGENALFFAERGQAVLGIDFVEAPIEAAKRKAEQRGVQAEFLQMDALTLTSFSRTFDSVIDCGLFHVFTDEDRIPYVRGLAHVTKPGGAVFLMCFSDDEPGDNGPRRISQPEIREAFANGWSIESIRATRFETNPRAEERDFSPGGPKAWLAVIRREN